LLFAISENLGDGDVEDVGTSGVELSVIEMVAGYLDGSHDIDSLVLPE
jgi:hypothetical protein